MGVYSLYANGLRSVFHLANARDSLSDLRLDSVGQGGVAVDFMLFRRDDVDFRRYPDKTHNHLLPL